MVRILHTADWHIGQTLNGWSRDSEHTAFLRRLPELVRSLEVDSLIVAGDVFDGVNPSAESTRMLYDALAALHASRPGLQTVLVAGNHDPAGRLEAPHALFEAIGVRAIGVIHREKNNALDVTRHLVPLRDRDGEAQAFVMAIPYLRAGDLPIVPQDSDEPGSPVVKASRRLYSEAVELARRYSGDAPIVVTGHLHCSGATEWLCGERLERQRLRLGEPLGIAIEQMHPSRDHVDEDEAEHGVDVVGIDCAGAFEAFARLRERLRIDALVDPVVPAKPVVEQVGTRRLLGPPGLDADDLRAELVGDARDDLVLHAEQLGDRLVEPVGPDMRAGLRLDQLHVDPHALAAALDAALEHVAHVEVAPDLANVDWLAPIGEGRVPGDDEGARDARQVGGQAIGDAVDEIFLLGAAAEIGEGEHDQR